MNIADLNIEAIVEKAVESEITQIDIDGIIRSELRKIVRESFAKKAEEMISDAASEFITVEIGKVMQGEIVISDGYHSKKHESFEVFVKSEFAKRLNDSYQVKNVIENLTKQRVDLLMKHEYAKVTEKIVDVLTQSTLVKK